MEQIERESQPLPSSGTRKRILLALMALSAVLAVYLVVNHYVKAYSDPEHWLVRAEQLAEGMPETRRPPLYPLFLAMALPVMGRAWVFLANLPFILGIVLLSYQLTVQCLRDVRPCPKTTEAMARTTGLICAVLLVCFRRGLLLEILNPFREAMAFCLMLGSLSATLSYLDRGRHWRGALGGLLLGMAIGTRETCLLDLPIYALLYLVYVIVQRRVSLVGGALAVGSGLLVGLLPFLINNAIHSGHFWVPSYAAADVVSQGAVAPPVDMPVPGMSLANFVTNGKNTLRYMLSTYRWWGWGAFALGLLTCAVRRHGRVWVVFVTGALINGLFYACYWYVKGRYLFVVDLFVVPVMAIGATTALLWLMGLAERTVPRVGRYARVATAGICALAFLALLVSDSVRGNERLKAWHVGTLREELGAKLEQPVTFLSVSRHYGEMLSWLLEGHYVEMGSVKSRDVKARGIDAVLSEMSPKAIALAEGHNAYYCGNAHAPLLENWLDFVRVANLGELSVPLETYGKPVKEDLYRLKAWSATNVCETLRVGSDTLSAMLMVDCLRLWDYPGRTYCRISVDGTLVDPHVPNGLHFVEWRRETAPDDRVEVVITSDAPLPAKPFLKSIPLNGVLNLALGARAKAWAHPLLSRDLVWRAPLMRNACVLFDRGTITVPRFCTADRTAFAVLTLECYREDPYFQGQETLTMSTGSSTRTSVLPRRRTMGTAAIDLGKGTGHLDWVKLELRTSLPGFEEQRKMFAKGTIKELSQVKLASLSVFSVGTSAAWPLDIDVGAVEDCVRQPEGFHGIERNVQGHSARWTSGEASLVFPAPAAGNGASVEVYTIRTRPDGMYEAPQFAVNAIPVEPEDTEREDRSGNEVVYRLRLGEDVLAGHGTNRLEIVSTPWVPAKVWESADKRTLGHLVHRVVIRPIAP
jgi:hypothetical protein